jgi:predicted AlkP superfamily phosphohydrolase/phosphomutase
MKTPRSLRALATAAAVVLVACDFGSSNTQPASAPVTPGSALPNTGLKILLIGIDGATWDVIDPLLADGRLPTLRRLIGAGVRAKLESEQPMLSPSIWTTIATGRSRSEHGITRFISSSSTPAAPRLVASTERRVPAIWNVLDSYHRSVGVIGWWVSWPAEPVDGFVVSDRVAWGRWQNWTDGRKSERFTYPEELFARIRERVVDPVKSPPLDEMFALADFNDAERELIRTSDHPLPFHGPSVFKFGFCEQKTYENIALELLPESQPELSMLFLVAVDPVSHNFWHLFRPDEFGGAVDRDQVTRLGDLVPAMYEHDDAYLAALLSKLDPTTVVMIISDHGFKASGRLPRPTQSVDYRVLGLDKQETTERPVNIGQSGVHDIDGILIASGGPFVPGATPTRKAGVLDVAPTLLALLGLPVAENMHGRVLEELIDPAFLRAHPVQRIAAYPITRPPQSARPGEVDDTQRTEQLKALGYVDVGGGKEPPERGGAKR